MMRLLLLVLILLLSPFNKALGQRELVYDVDTLVFNKKTGNSYFSESTGARLICTLLPMNYEKSLPGFQHQSNMNIVLIEKNDFLFFDRRISHKKGQLTEEGTISIIDAYLVEIDSTQSVVLNTSYNILDQKIIDDAAGKAAKSVRLK